MEPIRIKVGKVVYISSASELFDALKQIPFKYMHLPLYTSILDGSSVTEIKIDSNSITLL
jgi:hypothetical protein